MRVLVTGGAGFIGSHLCRRLLGLGHEVVCLDDFTSGDSANVADLLGHARFVLHKRDVMEPFHVRADCIYNLACPASPKKYQADPLRTLRVNVLGAFQVLELARRTGARVLQTSTSEVYGDPDIHPQQESYWGNVNPIGIRSCYDEGKRCAESIFVNYRLQHGVDTRIVRLFNTYGPNMLADDGRVVSNFVVQALQGRDLTIYGNGEQTRSFCYIDDIVEALMRVMALPDCPQSPINLGNPDEYTIRQLADKVVRLSRTAARVRHEPLPGDDPRRRKPDIALAKRLIHWWPRESIDCGLSKTIAYFRAKLGRQQSTRFAAVV